MLGGSSGRSLADARSGSTRRTYGREWRRFNDFCLQRILASQPGAADVVSDHLLSMGNTITDDTSGKGSVHAYSVSAINLAWRRSSTCTAPMPAKPPLCAHPRVSDTMRAICNRYATQRRRLAAPRAPLSLADLTPDHVRSVRLCQVGAVPVLVRPTRPHRPDFVAGPARSTRPTRRHQSCCPGGEFNVSTNYLVVLPGERSSRSWDDCGPALRPDDQRPAEQSGITTPWNGSVWRAINVCHLRGRRHLKPEVVWGSTGT